MKLFSSIILSGIFGIWGKKKNTGNEPKAENCASPEPQPAQEPAQPAEEKTAETTGDGVKMRFYNLIILDESGSMSGVTHQTISGCNETLDTIRAAQQQFADKQEHFVSIYVFQNGRVPSRYIIKNEPVNNVSNITGKDYEPGGSTPLNDAVGMTLTDLETKIAGAENTVGSVTIITDGYENASRHYSHAQIARMIERLKEMGWNFNFIGANIDAQATAESYNISNHLQFEQDEEGMRRMWERERMSKMSYARRMSEDAVMCNMNVTREEKVQRMREMEQNYYEEGEKERRITPESVSYLNSNEIFVFGSNLQGSHGGGAARTALRDFGAIMGQGVGLQGQSYAIPTMQGGVETIKPYVDEFIEFARQHPELRFLVTRIGCGVAGYKDSDIAPLFREAINVPNICLPEHFWQEL